jgi:hypothetical protein
LQGFWPRLTEPQKPKITASSVFLASCRMVLASTMKAPGPRQWLTFRPSSILQVGFAWMYIFKLFFSRQHYHGLCCFLSKHCDLLAFNSWSSNAVGFILGLCEGFHHFTTLS